MELKQTLKDFEFRDTYKHIHEQELFLRKSRKKLLIISLVYGGLITYLISLVV
ncbi:hypothetical protein [Panacibacter ginsenosidivorans]|uniref:hypothetical protein n=1 Tax=Panacibacter ginsenosidivorans TaxID=1813871 RepID=UPI00131574B4|nr:hypothetical protein [Panacibacter ginsenosidivorans]